MREIDVNSAEAYLRQQARIDPLETVRIRELTGGVSNIVLLVEPLGAGLPTSPNLSTEGLPGAGIELASGDLRSGASAGSGDPRTAAGSGDPRTASFVLKQARGRLRVEQPWFCGVERIFREVDVLRLCGELLDRQPVEANDEQLPATVPQVLFEDRANYLYAMTAAPPHVVWKAELLAGRTDQRIAASCGRLLGILHAGTWRDAGVAARFGDRRFFDALRLDPYYRRIAEVHGELRDEIARLIASHDENLCCLVHGDFSPKNLLVHAGGLTLVDFEVGHYGDPAFDLGFFLSHLVLKSVHAGREAERYLRLTETFWKAYRAQLAPVVPAEETAALGGRAVRNFAGCSLARVDGKSPVEYLTDEPQREAVRLYSAELLRDPPPTWPEALSAVRQLARLG